MRKITPFYFLSFLEDAVCVTGNGRNVGRNEYGLKGYDTFHVLSFFPYVQLLCKLRWHLEGSHFPSEALKLYSAVPFRTKYRQRIPRIDNFT